MDGSNVEYFERVDKNQILMDSLWANYILYYERIEGISPTVSTSEQNTTIPRGSLGC